MTPCQLLLWWLLLWCCSTAAAAAAATVEAAADAAPDVAADTAAVEDRQQQQQQQQRRERKNPTLLKKKSKEERIAQQRIKRDRVKTGDLQKLGSLLGELVMEEEEIVNASRAKKEKLKKKKTKKEKRQESKKKKKKSRNKGLENIRARKLDENNTNVQETENKGDEIVIDEEQELRKDEEEVHDEEIDDEEIDEEEDDEEGEIVFSFESEPTLHISNGSINVDVVLNVKNSDILQLEKLLQSAVIPGLEVINCVHPICSLNCPISELKQLATLEAILLIKPVQNSPNSGRVTSEGDFTLRSKQVRESFGFTGANIKIGVISDSYNCFGGAAEGVANGELPDNVQVLEDYPITNCANVVDDEGRALVEIIHDIAPNATVAFHGGFRGVANMAAAITALANAGCNIIVDDLSYFFEPFFQDGLLAQRADSVYKQFNILYFTAVGNYQNKVWNSNDNENGFVDSGLVDPTFGGKLHLFKTDPVTNNPITTQKLTLINNGGYTLFLQWDEPFVSVSGTVGSASDLDLLVYYNGTLLFSSTNNNVGQDPDESVSINTKLLGVVNASDVTVDVAITLVSGPPPKKMRLFAPSCKSFEFNVPGMADVIAQGNAAHAVAVGSSYVFFVPPYYRPPQIIAPYSSIGGTPICFFVNGTRMAQPEYRKQPRFVGPDAAQTSFFKILSQGVYRFHGTSAAVPHVAAVAALIMEAANDPSDLSAILTAMESTARVMDTPGSPAFNYVSGYGYVDAFAATSLFVPTAQPTPRPTAQPTPRPTAQPTPRPTARPTLQPTAPPTLQPTPQSAVVINTALIGACYRKLKQKCKCINTSINPCAQRQIRSALCTFSAHPYAKSKEAKQALNKYKRYVKKCLKKKRRKKGRRQRK